MHLSFRSLSASLREQGGKVDIVQPTDIYKLGDTPDKIGPMVHAESKGKGKSRIMLIAHMDTVYLRGMLKDQPFRVDGDKAKGPALPMTSRAWRLSFTR